MPNWTPAQISRLLSSTRAVERAVRRIYEYELEHGEVVCTSDLQTFSNWYNAMKRNDWHMLKLDVVSARDMIRRRYLDMLVQFANGEIE